MSAISGVTRIASSLLVLLVCSCGGGGGGGGGTGNNSNVDPVLTEEKNPAPSVSRTVSGIVSKGPIKGSTVCAFAFSGWVRGDQVENCVTTSANGAYSIDLGTYSGPLILEATAGDYLDEATGKVFNLQIPLHSAVIELPSTTNLVAITALTELAYQVAISKPEDLTASTIRIANEKIQRAFGVDDIFRTTPVDVLYVPESATEQEKRYALALATLSQFSLIHQKNLSRTLRALQECLSSAANCDDGESTLAVGLDDSMHQFIAVHQGFSGMTLPFDALGSKSLEVGLNDTGVGPNQCYALNDSQLISCADSRAIALSPTQDGMMGRDVRKGSNEQNGKRGFAFSRLAEECVRDDVTDLVWEIKTSNGSWRDAGRTFTNLTPYYNPNYAYGNPSDASGYVYAVNEAKLCGYDDWRLPTAAELSTIVDYDVEGNGPMIDHRWFPDTVNSQYWTSTRVLGDDAYAWKVDFSFGSMTPGGGYINRSFHLPVRLVRGGTPEPRERYLVSPDGQEVTDRSTKLIWRRCIEGMIWNGSTCTGAASTFTHEAAFHHAAVEAENTRTAWRVPNVKELASIAGQSKWFGAALDPYAFPDTPISHSWTSTPSRTFDGTAYAWIVEFYWGSIRRDSRETTNVLRLVRYGS